MYKGGPIQLAYLPHRAMVANNRTKVALGPLDANRPDKKDQVLKCMAKLSYTTFIFMLWLV